MFNNRECVTLDLLYFINFKMININLINRKLHAHMSDISGMALTYMQDLLITVGKTE